jgi:hypothetical protein
VDLRNKHYLLIYSGIIAFVFLLSFVLYALEYSGATRRVLFFPENFTGKLIGEERYIAARATVDENIKSLVEEIAYGPMNKKSIDLFPAGTRLLSSWYKPEDNVLYLDFSSDILFLSPKFPLDFTSMFQTVVNTVKFNFPGVQTITFFINGEIPAFEKMARQSRKLEMRFADDLLK